MYLDRNGEPIKIGDWIQDQNLGRFGKIISFSEEADLFSSFIEVIIYFVNWPITRMCLGRVHLNDAEKLNEDQKILLIMENP